MAARVSLATGLCAGSIWSNVMSRSPEIELAQLKMAITYSQLMAAYEGPLEALAQQAIH